MPNFNKVILAGHVVRDPELRYSPTGVAICKITLAVSEKWKDKTNGDLREKTAFVDTSWFSQKAETLAQYVKKGHPLLIEGKIEQENWEDKNTGQKRSKLSVRGDSFTFLRGRSEGGGDDSPAAHPRQAPAPQPQQQELPSGEPEEDDVPF